MSNGTTREVQYLDQQLLEVQQVDRARARTYVLGQFEEDMGGLVLCEMLGLDARSQDVIDALPPATVPVPAEPRRSGKAAKVGANVGRARTGPLARRTT